METEIIPFKEPRLQARIDANDYASSSKKSAGYLGSKAASGAFQAIIALMPPHDTYLELFAGSGAVLLRKPPARRSVAVDLDSAVLDALPGDCPSLERVCGDALAFLGGFHWQGAGRVLIYADPPYLQETRTSRHRYKHEMTRGQHVALLAALRGVPASVILSGYPSPLYDDALPGWNTREFQAMTRGGVRTEKLWFNFRPSAVHWASYAGEDFTDRQRIKRKAARWAANYRGLPPGERLAVLAGLLAVAGEDRRE
jgi:DNA adenine methylase